MSTPKIRLPRARKAHLGLFRYSAWDAVPAALLCLQLILILAFVALWPQLGWPARLGFGGLYALSIGWCLDTAAHNFVHNRFFASEALNRLTDLVFTVVLGNPQTVYAYTHMRHHAGSSDRIGPDGSTVDPISLYRHGADGKAEPMASYVFMQYWRDESPLVVIRQIRARRPKEADRALQELCLMAIAYVALLALDWQAMLFLAPFFYLGQCFSALIAYYEHFGADPDTPIATGVSTREPIYNWLFLNNGYHTEHHFRPKQHWAQMPELYRETAAEQSAAGVRTLRFAHCLGFLDPSTWAIPTARGKTRPRVRA